jgi:hypothetical protein
LKDRVQHNLKEKMNTERKMLENKISELEKKLTEQEVSKDH